MKRCEQPGCTSPSIGCIVFETKVANAPPVFARLPWRWLCKTHSDRDLDLKTDRGQAVMKLFASEFRKREDIIRAQVETPSAGGPGQKFYGLSHGGHLGMGCPIQGGVPPYTEAQIDQLRREAVDAGYCVPAPNDIKSKVAIDFMPAREAREVINAALDFGPNGN